MNKKFKSLFTVIFISLFQAASICQSDDILKNAISQYNNTRIHFNQISGNMESSGTILIRKPDFRIDYYKPERIIISYLHGKMTVLHEELNQITPLPTEEIKKAALVNILEGNAEVISSIFTDNLIVMDISSDLSEKAEIILDRKSRDIMRITIKEQGRNIDLIPLYNEKVDKITDRDFLLSKKPHNIPLLRQYKRVK